MHLIHIDGNGELHLTSHGPNYVPRYAILSHTWGADEDEVTFQDFVSGMWKHKRGACKLDLCRDKAREDSLEYFWIDTCCIDKANHAELAEAIVSMFNWYREAAKCYVYLTDVSAAGDWGVAFYHSRWFTRGWTLQELLAPKSVKFFSVEGVRLGDRNSLEDMIGEITGLPIRALRGRSLSEYKVDDRMQWTHNRQTTREEDQAYCLQGLFGVTFPPMYGEGRNSALRRLWDEIGKGAKRTDLWLEANHYGPQKPPTPMKEVEQAPLGTEGIELLKQTLQRNEEHLGAEHPDTLSSMDNLGLAYQQQGDFHRAAFFHRRALTYREQLKHYQSARSSLLRLASATSGLKELRTELDTWNRSNDLYIHTRDVGGCGGNRFMHLAPIGLRVEVMRFWYKDYCITGVEAYYSDGSKSEVQPDPGSEFTSYEFAPGEVMTEFTMWNNQYNDRLGCIEWKTLRYEENGHTERKRFFVGADFTKKTSLKRVETGTGILVGIHGRAGNELDALGFIFLTPTTSTIGRDTSEILKDQTRPRELYRRQGGPANLVYMDGVGGSGGSCFYDIADESTSVKNIHVWQESSMIKALQLELHDGSFLPRRGHGDGDHMILTFSEHDVISGVSLWVTNGEDRLSRIQITSYDGRYERKTDQETGPWKSGHYMYERDLQGGGTLVGFYGYAGLEIDWLGLVFRRWS